MKQNLLLLLFASTIGICLGGAIGYSYLSKPEGAAFESPDDLRKAMLARDERDIKSNGNVSLRSIVQPHPSDAILYTLRPNLDVRFQNVPVNTNSFGMRGPEYSIEKPEGVYRIALLGDSFAFGWGVEEEKIFARTLERYLTEKLEGVAKVEVLNFGTPGYSTFQEVHRFEEIGLQFKPDAVLLYFIDNDFGLPFFIQNFNKPTELLPAQSFKKIKGEAQSEEAQKRSRRFQNFIDPNSNLKMLGRLAEENNFDLFLAINPRRGADRDVQRLWAMRTVKNINYLSTFPELKNILDARQISAKDLVLHDDPHPTALWHDLMGELLAKQLFLHLQ